MAKKLLSIDVHGKDRQWSFSFYGEEKYIKEWVDDGLNISIIENVIPEWVVNVGLLRLWCFLQDLVNFKNPFKNW